MIETRLGIREFENAHLGAEVWVLGAGGSLNYLDPAFFEGKTVVSVNSAARVFGITPTYVVVKEHTEEAIPNLVLGVPVICSAGPYGNDERPAAPPGVHVFEHQTNVAQDFDARRHWPTEPDQLVVSMSTITTAMHFAAYTGAATIMLVGHDCGRLGDELYVKGYGGETAWLPDWLEKIERQSIAVKRELVKRYGVRIYSLNPFLNFNLEGTPFAGQNRINTW